MSDDQPHDAAGAAAPYPGLRARLLAADASTQGVTVDDGRVWGALLDMATDTGIATLVCLADGTTSLYTTSGGAVLGAGAHEHVRAVTATYLSAVDDVVGELRTAVTDPQALPRSGFVQLIALRAGRPPVGRLVPERELRALTHALSLAYVAAHDVITALRLLDQSRKG